MSHDIAAYGVGIAIIFAFVRWAVPVMPKSIAWAGVVAGAVVVLVDLFMPEIKMTIPVIALLVIGLLCIGGAIHLARHPKDQVRPPDTASQSKPAATNQMGSVRDNSGIVTQDQTGDNVITKK